MYWIEIYFENGKTLKKETDSLNDSYAVLRRYENGIAKWPRVQYIKAGNKKQTTYKKSYLTAVVL